MISNEINTIKDNEMLNYSNKLLKYYKILQKIGLEKGYNIPFLLYENNCMDIESFSEVLTVDDEINQIIKDYNLDEFEKEDKNVIYINKSRFYGIINALVVLFIVNGIQQYELSNKLSVNTNITSVNRNEYIDYEYAYISVELIKFINDFFIDIENNHFKKSNKLLEILDSSNYKDNIKISEKNKNIFLKNYYNFIYIMKNNSKVIENQKYTIEFLSCLSCFLFSYIIYILMWL